MIETIRKLELHDGDVICLPADTRHEEIQAFSNLLNSPAHKGKRLIVVIGEVHTLDEAAMNAAGWYRK